MSIRDNFWPLTQSPDVALHIQGYVDSICMAIMLICAVVILVSAVRRWVLVLSGKIVLTRRGRRWPRRSTLRDDDLHHDEGPPAVRGPFLLYRGGCSLVSLIGALPAAALPETKIRMRHRTAIRLYGAAAGAGPDGRAARWLSIGRVPSTTRHLPRST